MRLISECLIGVNCNFESKNWLNPKLLEAFKQGDLFPVCPEVLDELSVSRVPAEIIGGDDSDVLGQSQSSKHAWC
jgi:uncharacterized protein YbbK (DUF523 family)